MGRPTPEGGGGTPQNQGLSEFKPLSKEKGVGWGVKKAEEPKQQLSDADREAYEQLKQRPRRPTVFVGRFQVPRPLSQNPGEQKGQPETSKPNPAEQQAAERLGKPPPEKGVVETLDLKIEEMILRAAMGDPKEAARLRELAKTDASIRQFLIEGPISLTRSSPDLSILRIFRKSEDIP